MTVSVYAVDRPDLAPFAMSDRFRLDIAYFMSVPGQGDVPRLPEGQYWVCLDDARRWLDAGSILLVSPLDSAHKTEVELSEEQEAWLEWMVVNQVQRIALN